MLKLAQNLINGKVVDADSDNEFSGINTFTQPIYGVVMEAYWGDLAECYESDKEYPKGTLIEFGGTKEITIAQNEVNAVVTSEPGFVLNTQIKDGLAIALVGRVPVRVIGKVNKFDYLELSDIPGVATLLKKGTSNIIARALEDKETEEEGLVLCVVKFEI